MKPGLYSRGTVALFLRKKVEEIERMIEEDGLPAVPVPSTARQPRHKFSATQLTTWLNLRSTTKWTVEQVIAELDRCEPSKVDATMQAALEAVTELRSLCDAAEPMLRKGLPCPRLVKSIKDVAKELSVEGAAA
jgi:hypothetical protein